MTIDTNFNSLGIAIVVALTSVISPLILAWRTGVQRQKEKQEDYRRQDEVAAKAEEAARLLSERQDESAAKAAEAADLLLAANERVAKQSAEASTATQGQLRQIHTLVNSNLTEAQRRELEATKSMLVTMEEVVSLKRDRGVEPSERALEEILAAQGRIAALERDLAHKEERTTVADDDFKRGGAD